MTKAYTLEELVRTVGYNVELPIFTSVQNAINHMEQMIIPCFVNCKYERDDSELEQDERARWYELINIDDSRIFPNKSKTLVDHRRTGDYYIVRERELI